MIALKRRRFGTRIRDQHARAAARLLMHDNRLFTRVPSTFEVDLFLKDGSLIGGRISNLSMRGMYFRTDARPEVGARCSVLLFPATHDHPELKVEVEGEIARWHEDGLGVRFSEFSFDSFDHLQGLVTYAADDAGVIEEEIETHLGARRPD